MRFRAESFNQQQVRPSRHRHLRLCRRVAGKADASYTSTMCCKDLPAIVVLPPWRHLLNVCADVAKRSTQVGNRPGQIQVPHTQGARHGGMRRYNNMS